MLCIMFVMYKRHVLTVTCVLLLQPHNLPAEHAEALAEEAGRTPGQVWAPDAAAPTLVLASLLPWEAESLIPSAKVCYS